MKIYFASDHAGFEMKQSLIEYVRSLGHEVTDCGPTALDPEDDYPVYVTCAASAVSHKTADRAIVIGASGQGEAMVANRFSGVRAAVYYGDGASQLDMGGKTLGMLESTREHNDANILSLGARFIDLAEAKDAVRLWLEVQFSGEERHLRRIKQIDALQQSA